MAEEKPNAPKDQDKTKGGATGGSETGDGGTTGGGPNKGVMTGGKTADDSETGDGGGASGGGSITSPEGILMLCLAAIFDIIGLIPLIGDISDIFAGIIFGGWMIITGKKAIKNFLIAFILEAFPIVSDVAPFVSLLSGGKIPASWIGCVYKTLNEG
jgi:hypothetical protein